MVPFSAGKHLPTCKDTWICFLVGDEMVKSMILAAGSQETSKFFLLWNYCSYEAETWQAPFYL